MGCQVADANDLMQRDPLNNLRIKRTLESAALAEGRSIVQNPFLPITTTVMIPPPMT
jgi:hypothetical protein